MLSSEAELLAHRNVTSIYTPWRILYTLIVFNEKNNLFNFENIES